MKAVIISPIRERDVQITMTETEAMKYKKLIGPTSIFELHRMFNEMGQNVGIEDVKIIHDIWDAIDNVEIYHNPDAHPE